MLPYFKRLLGGQVSIRACALLGVILLALFGLVEAGAWEFHHVRLKSHVRHAIPRVREETTRELRTLTQAIDNYKSRLGGYPPDHLVSQKPVIAKKGSSLYFDHWRFKVEACPSQSVIH